MLVIKLTEEELHDIVDCVYDSLGMGEKGKECKKCYLGHKILKLLRNAKKEKQV